MWTKNHVALCSPDTGAKTVLDVSGSEGARVLFTPKGERFVLGGTAWDPRSQKSVWTLDAHEELVGFASSKNLAIVNTDATSVKPHAYRFLDANGPCVKMHVSASTAFFMTAAVSEDGALIAASKDGHVVVIDTGTFATRDVPLPGETPIGVSNDGAFIWYACSPDHVLTAFRVSDGRKLLFGADLVPFTGFPRWSS